MGYSTDFDGQINIVPPLNPKEIEYLRAFFDVRHMHREDGPYYVAGGQHGTTGADGIFNHNQPDPSQPGLWCDLEVSSDGTAIRWNGAEKTYDLPEWIEYIIKHFIGKDPIAKQENSHFSFLVGHTLDGVLDAEGEEAVDIWRIVVTNNEVVVEEAKISYE